MPKSSKTRRRRRSSSRHPGRSAARLCERPPTHRPGVHGNPYFLELHTREVRKTHLPRIPVNKHSKIGFRLSRGGRLKGYGYGERLRTLPRVWRQRRVSGRRRGAVVLLLCAQEEMALRVRLLQCCPPSDGIGDHLARVPSRLRPCAHEDGAFLGPRPRASAVNFREPTTPEVRGTQKFSRNQTVASR